MPIEREFKYLLLNSPVVEFAAKEQATESRQIEQGYFDKGGRIRRIIKLDSKSEPVGPTKHVFTYKHDLLDKSGIMEIETSITATDYKRLWPDTTHRLIKTRYDIPFEGHTWEIDFFHSPTDDGIYLVMAECEVDPKSDPDMRPAPPPIVKNFLRYTVDEFDKRFTNRKLSDPAHVASVIEDLGINCHPPAELLKVLTPTKKSPGNNVIKLKAKGRKHDQTANGRSKLKF